MLGARGEEEGEWAPTSGYRFQGFMTDKGYFKGMNKIQNNSNDHTEVLRNRDRVLATVSAHWY